MTHTGQPDALRNLVICIVVLAIAGTILGIGGYCLESSPIPADNPPENRGLNCREICHASSFGGQNCKVICS